MASVRRRGWATSRSRRATWSTPPGGADGPALAANSNRTFPATGRCGISLDAVAVAISPVAVNPDLGFMRE